MSQRQHVLTYMSFIMLRVIEFYVVKERALAFYLSAIATEKIRISRTESFST